MRFSRSLICTTKDSGGETESLASHEFLVRGGFILQVASGIYDFLPLGKMMLDNIRSIIKDELDNAGCHEVTLAFVTPCELWQKSKRFEKYGKELLRIEDRKQNSFVLSPTCEELMVELAKAKVNSYKQLPLNIYQIHLKFRDELRPRFGLLRGREFWMKDGYSFHESEEDMLREFALMEETYKKIFTRLGLNFKVVEADSGAIGGKGSKEFMVVADAGEDTLAVCDSCDYAANIEAACRKPKTHFDGSSEPEELHTPNLKSIEELSGSLSLPKSSFVKAIAKKALYNEGEEGVVLFFVCGDDELEETKAVNACGANELQDISAEELENNGVTAGFIGPKDMTVTMFIDCELKNRKNMVIGANRSDYHIGGFSFDGFNDELFKDLIAVKLGDECPKCQDGKLSFVKGIEVGHIFQLRERYSEPMDAKFLDKNGKSRPFVMGTYGIGVSRLIAAIVEQSHDEKGCILPLPVAPYQAVVIISNIKDEKQKKYATECYEQLKNSGVKALLDDRDERYGHKMADFELIGFPYAVIFGKNVESGEAEIVARSDLQKQIVPVATAAQNLITKLQGDK